MPAFIHHGIVNHAQHHFPAAAQSYGDAEPGNRVKIIHRPVNGVYNPFILAVPVPGVSFFSQNSVVGKHGKNFLRNQFLGKLVQLQLDIILAGFIHLLLLIKMLLQESSGGFGGLDGRGHFK